MAFVRSGVGVIKLLPAPCYSHFKRVFSMAAEKLANVPVVDIDPEGTFKYILIKLAAPNAPEKKIVRGYKWAAYHTNIYDDLVAKLDPGVTSECLGGGKIQHDPAKKTIIVYGLSTGFGKADHEVSVGLLKTVYQDYDITWSDAEKI